MERFRQKAVPVPPEPKPEVDQAIETMDIQKHDPEKYMESLKETIEATNGPVKVRKNYS